jgi:hypothetical protein
MSKDTPKHEESIHEKRGFTQTDADACCRLGCRNDKPYFAVDETVVCLSHLQLHTREGLSPTVEGETL